MRLERRRVRVKTGVAAATELDAFWFIGVSVCLCILVVVFLLAILGMIGVRRDGRRKYNAMVDLKDLFDGISELMSASGSCKLNKEKMKPLYFGIDNEKAHIGIKDTALVGDWNELEIEGTFRDKDAVHPMHLTGQKTFVRTLQTKSHNGKL
ncbi:unnamed protein product [Agarophyton chilense]